MAFTTDDLDAINDALATGEMEVEFADGKRVRYRSVGDLMRAKQHIESRMNSESGRRPRRGVRVNVMKGV